MAGCVAFVNSGSNSDSGELAQVAAQSSCETMVKNHLKSPSTAQFSNETETGFDPIAITGHVDSENGFGAMLRSSFHCTGTLQGGGVETTLDSIQPQ